MTRKIFLIRHAQTHLSKERKYCGRLNPPLTEEGLKSARFLSQYFQSQKIDFIYSSPAKRAIETATAIFNNANVKITDELCEMDFGLWEGLSYDDVMNKYALLYSKWLTNPYEVNIPKGEALRDAEERVTRFLKRIIHICKNRDIAIVTHFGPIRLILSYVFVEKKCDFWKRKIDLCSINILEYDGIKFIAHSDR